MVNIYGFSDKQIKLVIFLLFFYQIIKSYNKNLKISYLNVYAIEILFT